MGSQLTEPDTGITYCVSGWLMNQGVNHGLFMEHNLFIQISY